MESCSARWAVSGIVGQQRAIVAPQQIVANCFTLVAEAETHKVEKRLAIQGRELRFGLRNQSHHRRVHFGRWTKRPGGHGEKQLGRAQKLRLHAQVTVIARSRARRQSLGHFLLHQKHRAIQLRAERQRLFQDGRGNVIRQIPGHGHRSPLREVGLQNVRLHQREPRLIAKLGAQVLHQHRIDFDARSRGPLAPADATSALHARAQSRLLCRLFPDKRPRRFVPESIAARENAVRGAVPTDYLGMIDVLTAPEVEQ